MTRISKLVISNFKAFPERVEIPFDGKNVLIFGENGSGKSSIFYALHALLQSSEKSNDKIQNYFEENHEKSLINIFSNQSSEDSFIELQIKDYSKPDIAPKSSTISYNEITTNTSKLIKEINQASDFINYKVLMEFHNFRHSEEIDLFNTFYKEIFPYFSNSRKELLSAIIDLLKEEAKTLITVGTKEKYEFTKKLDDFNSYAKRLINDIKKSINDYIKDYFSEPTYKIKVDIEYKDSVYDSKKHVLVLPSIKLKTTLPEKNNEEVQKPHSFFNEARLTAIALSIRFALLKNRLKTSSLKVLVLDDLLISLDMSNRIKVLKMIFKEFSDFQLVIMTHDKSFYNEVKRRVLTQDWKFFELINRNNVPEIRSGKNELEKAKEYFEDKNYELCATELRKIAEETLKLYINPEKLVNKEFKGLEDLIRESKNKFKVDNYKKFNRKFGVERFEQIFGKKDFTLDEVKLITKDLDNEPSLTNNLTLKGRLKALKNELVKFTIEQYEFKDNEEKIFNELKAIKDRIFNPASHSSEVPFFGEELREAIEIIQELQNILISRRANRDLM